MLPLVHRELRTWARKPTLHLNRLRLGILIIVTCAVLLVSADPQSRTAAGAFTFFSSIALVFCLAEGLRKTADAISQEKREGTLGFLFLTDLRGADIVLGKLTGAAVRSFNGLLAFVPILAITLLRGGVTLGEFWRTVLALFIALFVSLSVCIFVSALTREKSLSGSIALMVMICFGPLVLSFFFVQAMGALHLEWIKSASPVHLLLAARENYYVRHPGWFWIGAGILFLLTIAALMAASMVLPHAWHDKPVRPIAKTSARRDKRAQKRRRWQLDSNPVRWLAYDHSQYRRFAFLFYPVASLILAAQTLVLFMPEFDVVIIGGIGLVLLSLLLLLYIATETSMTWADLRQNGGLELLLATPVQPSHIIRGQYLALRDMFATPAILILIGYVYVGAALFWIGSFGPAAQVLIFTFHFLLSLWTVAAVGMWMGLTAKSRNRAFLKTIFLGILLPGFFGSCLPVVIQIVILAVATSNLHSKFRRYVAERYLQGPGFMLAPPLPADPTVPPVIR